MLKNRQRFLKNRSSHEAISVRSRLLMGQNRKDYRSGNKVLTTQRSAKLPHLITAMEGRSGRRGLLLVVCSIAVIAVSVGPTGASIAIAATLTPAGIVVSGASITTTPGLKAATSIAPVSSSSGEPSAPAASPTEEAPASSRATPVSSGPVIRRLASLVNSDLPPIHRLPIHSHHGILSVIDIFKGDKPEASGSLSLPVLYHHHFRDLPILGEDLLQRLLVGVEAETSHEKLAFI